MKSDLREYPLVKPYFPPGVKIAPKEKVDEILRKMDAELAVTQKVIAEKAKDDGKDEEEDPVPPPKMEPTISRDGAMDMGFRGKMKVPSWIKTDPTTGRLLAATPDGGEIPLDEMDVTRDILDLRFVLKSGINPDDIKYQLIIKEWTEDKFVIKVNFSDPYQISQGEERDAAFISVKNPALFVSAETGKPFDPAA